MDEIKAVLTTRRGLAVSVAVATGVSLLTAVILWLKERDNQVDPAPPTGSSSHSVSSRNTSISRKASPGRLQEVMISVSTANNSNYAAPHLDYGDSPYASEDDSTVVEAEYGSVNSADRVQRYCSAGLSSLNQAITLWRSALNQLSEDENPRKRELIALLEEQVGRCEASVSQYEAGVSLDELALEVTFSELRRIEISERAYAESGGSETDSFVSATDLADLSDLDTYTTVFDHLPLYRDGLLELRDSFLPCRTVRTATAGCLSDAEFIAKIYCLRLAFGHMFSSRSEVERVTNVSRELLSRLVMRGGDDPSHFEASFTALIRFCDNSANEDVVTGELSGRGVPVISFYDVILDFVLLDAFDDLESPPSSLKSVMQNRWLSESFRQRAISTAIWSVLKAKRSMLHNNDGFLSRYYDVSESVSPALAWGFLGPPSEFQDLCYFFRDTILDFYKSIFSFEDCHYTNVPAFAADVQRLLWSHVDILQTRLNS